MKLKLERLGKSYCKGPLLDYGLLERPWEIGDIKSVDDSVGHQLLAKYPALFRTVGSVDEVVEKAKEKPKNKVYEDKIIKPKGIK